MSTIQWLRADECPLLHDDFDLATSGAPASSRLVQRLLEICLTHPDMGRLPEALLEEIGSVLRADQVAILEASPNWPVLWQYARRGARAPAASLPRSFLGDVLDRMAGSCQPPGGAAPAYVATVIPSLALQASIRTRPLKPEAQAKEGQRHPHVLLASRAREEFSAGELEYAVAAGHYFGMALEKIQAWQQQSETCERLEALVNISHQLVEQRETIPLLEHIAEQACRLLRCERASIFLWDEGRKELVGRPALGLPDGELRIPDHVGVVGKVLQTGEIIQVDDVQADSTWSSDVDDASGFKTRNLLCIPLNDGEGKRVGALEVMNKTQGRFSPQDVETLHALGRQTVAALENVREREALLRSNAEFEGQARQGCRIVGESPPIQALRATLERVARTNLPVLILGESGTGKDVVARAIHYSSARHNQPFVPVNCAAIAESLLESELFGHEKGAFTGADQQRPGKFEAANGGTLFLDEVGDLSAGGQASLLRVLEEKVVYRVGGTQPIPVDVRIIAATNRELADTVRQKKFREDLFYRLSVVTLKLPPLRERQDDILILAEHFLRQFCSDAGRRVLKFSAEAKKRLLHHNWPGNVRELRNLIERVAYLCAGDKIEGQDLPFIARPLDDSDDFGHLPLSDATEMFQFQHIKRAIKRAGGNMSDAAKFLGLHRPNLYRKMKDLEEKLKQSFDEEGK